MPATVKSARRYAPVAREHLQALADHGVRDVRGSSEFGREASAASGTFEKLLGIEVRQQTVLVVEGNEAMRIVRPDRANVEHQAVNGDIDPDNAAIIEGLRQSHSDL